MGRTESRGSQNYVTILGSEGNFRLEVPEGTEGCVAREYEDKDKNKKIKYEMVFDAIDGDIVDMELYEGNYGTNLLITLQHEDGKDVISFNTNTNYGEDILKKLPNVDVTKPIYFSPYKFIGDNGKDLRGVTVKQKDCGWNDDKVPNFFYDPDKKKPVNGAEKVKFPKATKKGGISKDKWRAYFNEMRIFMIDYADENIVSKFEKEEKPEAEGEDDDW